MCSFCTFYCRGVWFLPYKLYHRKLGRIIAYFPFFFLSKKIICVNRQGCNSFPPASKASRELANLTEITFLPGNIYPHSHHLQGGMKDSMGRNTFYEMDPSTIFGMVPLLFSALSLLFWPFLHHFDAVFCFLKAVFYCIINRKNT